MDDFRFKVPVSAEDAEAFRQFSRNGRWGTCGDCPRDSDGHAYPEFCEHKGRSDHHLTITQLAARHTRYVEEVESGKITHRRR